MSPQARDVFERLRQVTEGRYEVLSELGRGGMAIVFLGYQKSLDRQVAIKVLLPLLGYNPEIVERFKREARTQGKLNHPNIISVFEVYDEAGLTFFTMPYVPGKSLRSALKEQPRRPVETVIRYLVQAADALAFAHRHGVVHRDVKPENILCDRDRDRLILTDFGIAKALAAETTLTTPGDLLGTPRYMSPEQGEGMKTLDGRADQYSLGLIGYEMLTGRPAFEADSLAELIYKHRFEDPESLDALCPEAPPTLRDAILRSISKDREARFPSMEEFRHACESAGREAAAHAHGSDELADPLDTPTLRVPTPPGLRRSTPHGVDDAGAAGAERAGRPERVRMRRRAWSDHRLKIGAGAILALLAAALIWAVDTDRDPVSTTADTRLEGAAGATAEDAIQSPTGVTSSDDASGTAGGGDGATGPDGATGTAGAATAGTPAPSESETATPTPRTAGEAGRTPTRPGAAAGGATITRDTRAEADRAAAEREAIAARDAADAARRDAAAADAAAIFGAEFTALDRELESAKRALQVGDHGRARTLFAELRPRYDEMARRATGWKSAADAARKSASVERRAAVQAGAETRAADRLRGADAGLQRAEAALASNAYADAVRLFDETARTYRELAAELTAAAEREADRKPAVDREEPAAKPAPEVAIAGLIETFREAFEQESFERLAAEVYGREVPGGDAKLLSAVFDRADDLRVASETRRVSIDGASARADIRLDLGFRQTRTGETGTTQLDLRLHFDSSEDGWRLVRLERR